MSKIWDWLSGKKEEEIVIEPKEDQPLDSWMASDEYACKLDPVVFKEFSNEVLKPISVSEEVTSIAAVPKKTPKKIVPKKKIGAKVASIHKPAHKAPIKKI